MKTYKPYLSLTKVTGKYELCAIVTASKGQTITGIRQEEVKSSGQPYWGVIITLSDSTELVNGPENPIFSTTVDIMLDKSVNYEKILCSTEIVLADGKYGPPAGEPTPINFDDTTT